MAARLSVSGELACTSLAAADELVGERRARERAFA